MRKVDSNIPCPECGEKEMEIYVEKAAGEALLNILATGERLINILKEGEMESEMKTKIKSLECQKCGNKESKFDYSLIERSYDIELEDEES